MEIERTHSRPSRLAAVCASRCVATESNTTGIDVGLEKLYVDSKNNQALPQKHLRKSESELAKLQRKLEDKTRSMKAKRLVRRAISRLHQNALFAHRRCEATSADSSPR